MAPSLASWLTSRRWLFLAAALTIAIGLASRAFLHGAPAKITGVALYATLVYLLVRAAFPRAKRADASHPPSRLSVLIAPAAVALAISWGVEFLQLTPLSARLSAVHPVLRLVFGEVFSATDLIWYAIGVVAGVLVDVCFQRRPSRAVT